MTSSSLTGTSHLLPFLQVHRVNFVRYNAPYIMSVQYIETCSVHWGISLSTPRDVQYTRGISLSTLGTFSTLGDITEYIGGYHDKCGGRSMGKQLNLYGNPSVLNSPRCTHDIPHTHNNITPLYWNPRCTHDIPQCTHVYSPPPSVLTPPGVLHRHHAGWRFFRLCSLGKYNKRIH